MEWWYVRAGICYFVLEFFCPKELHLPLCKTRYQCLLRNSQMTGVLSGFQNTFFCPVFVLVLLLQQGASVGNCKKTTTVESSFALSVGSLVRIKVKGFILLLCCQERFLQKLFRRKVLSNPFSRWCSIVILKSCHLTGFYLLEVCPLLCFCVTLIKCLV